MASEYYFEKCWFNTENNRKFLIWQITVVGYVFWAVGAPSTISVPPLISTDSSREKTPILV